MPITHFESLICESSKTVPTVTVNCLRHAPSRHFHRPARVLLPGLLLAGKGDRVAMNSSVETRYPFLDEDVYDFLAKLHPVWKMRGLCDKLILRYLAQRHDVTPPSGSVSAGIWLRIDLSGPVSPFQQNST